MERTTRRTAHLLRILRRLSLLSPAPAVRVPAGISAEVDEKAPVLPEPGPALPGGCGREGQDPPVVVTVQIPIAVARAALVEMGRQHLSPSMLEMYRLLEAASE